MPQSGTSLTLVNIVLLPRQTGASCHFASSMARCSCRAKCSTSIVLLLLFSTLAIPVFTRTLHAKVKQRTPSIVSRGGPIIKDDLSRSDAHKITVALEPSGNFQERIERGRRQKSGEHNAIDTTPMDSRTFQISTNGMILLGTALISVMCCVSGCGYGAALRARLRNRTANSLRMLEEATPTRGTSRDASLKKSKSDPATDIGIR